MNALAIVHHGNQFLITDGYLNREGISEIVKGFDAVLALHEKYRVPLNLHLSGTLIEAAAWHAPDFFEIVKTLRTRGLLELVGSAYAQNIMPFFGAEHNLRQLNETLCLYQHHLGAQPADIKTFWVPERVWNPETLVPLLESASLQNGGFHHVLVDDRLAFSCVAEDGMSERRAFDECPTHADSRPFVSPFKIAQSRNLIALPISKPLRYNIPPRERVHWQTLEQLFASADPDDDQICFYADDLEKAAGLGAWGSHPWQASHLEPYEHFLNWLTSSEDLQSVLVSDWMQTHPVATSKPVETGTYYELAYTFRAGEDYRGWWDSEAWLSYRTLLANAEQKLLSLPHSARNPLCELAWKQLMASSYEAGWHDVDGESVSPAPWARAAAAHVRAVLALALASEWMSRRDGKVHVAHVDADGDGDAEVILRNDALCAVISPKCGGRIIYFIDFSRGALVVGNPADDWNWQEEQNKFMEIPRNHPGAFSDVGCEEDVYAVASLTTTDNTTTLQIVDQTSSSALYGTVKSFSLTDDDSVLRVAYKLPETVTALDVEFCLSPDYLKLLRLGKNAIRARTDGAARVALCGETRVHVKPFDLSGLEWDETETPRVCGHGLVYTLHASARDFACEIGVG